MSLTGTRIAVVNWRDPDHRAAGGAEKYAWEFAVGLRDAGARVEFVTGRDAGQVRREAVDGIDVVRRGGLFTYYLGAAGHLLRRRRQLDAVVEAATGLPTFAPLIVPRTTPVVLVVHHVHQDQFTTHFGPLAAWLARTVERRVMPMVYRNRRTLAVSGSTRTQLQQQLGWSGPVDVLPNGADRAPRRETGDTGDTRTARRVVVLGRLVTHKRVDVVLRAFAAAAAELPDLTLDVIGRGPEQERLAALVDELALADRVRIHGFLPEGAKAEVLDRSDLHVCASDGEGWGQVVIEAAAHGVPTLARDVPGLCDSVIEGDTGWLLPGGGDEQQLVDGLSRGIVGSLRALESSEKAAAVATSCRTWAEKFSWPTMRHDAARVLEEELCR